MRHYVLTVILSMLPFIVCGQKQTVTGTLLSAVEQTDEALPYAEVTVLSLPDSVLVKGTVSNLTGYFKISYMRKPNTSYLLRASFLGYAPFTVSLSREDGNVNLGNIRLKDDVLRLSGVTVKADLRPVVQKKDSVFYNVAAYKVPEDSYLEALIKRIPGLDYNPDTHAIKYNGHSINQILINGQDLFGGDNKLALTNLPIGIIKRVKVYDKRPEEEKMTGGRRGGNKNYVLDLETKSELNNMVVAEAKVGVGTARKKDLSGSIMKLDPKKGSVMLMGKNTNRYIASDYPGNIHRDLNGAISQRNKEKLDVSVSGNYSYNHEGNISANRNELYQTGGNRYHISESDNHSNGKTMGGNARVMWRPNAKTFIQVNAYGNASDSENAGSSRLALFDVMPTVDITNPFADMDKIASDSRINYSDDAQFSKRKDNSFSVSGNIVRMLSKRGDNISFDVMASQMTSSSDNYKNNSTYYYRLKNTMGGDSIDNRKQYIHTPSSKLNYSARMAYTFVLNKKHFLQLGYAIAQSREKQNGNTYDLSSVLSPEDAVGFLPGNYEHYEIDSLYNRNRSMRLLHTVSLGYDYNGEYASLSARMDMAPGRRSIQSRTGEHVADTSAMQIDWNPSLTFTYTPDNVFLQLSYVGYTQQPDLQSLVAATDYSSPLNVIHSNPNLKMAYTYMVNMMFSAHQKGISANASFRQTFNAMAQAVYYNSETGGCETYPMNVDGNWGISGQASYEKKIGPVRMYISGSGSLQNNATLTSDGVKKENVEKTNTRSTAFSSNLRASYLPQWGDLSATVFWSFLSSDNSLQNIKSYSRTYRIDSEANINLPFGLGVKSDAKYMLRSGTGIGEENRNEVVWNMGVWWRFLKKKKARIDIEWVDILNQHKDYSGSVTATGFYESYQRQVGRYVMASFSYKF